MDMSAACTAPVHAEIKGSERAHPRFAEYTRYRDAMTRQLVTCGPFSAWLAATEEFEKGREVVFEVTATDAALAPGWYKNRFFAKQQFPRTFGPFGSRAAALTA